MNEKPIGVFDSGVGGISVLAELTALMPKENYIYYGDSYNAPYGTKSTEEVKRLTLNCIQFLVEKGVKAIVVACNTATSAAVHLLRERFDIPVIGLEPALKPAILYKKNSRILVMATPVTLREEKFMHLSSLYENLGEIVPVPCDGLAELIESGITEGIVMEKYLNRVLSPFTDKKVDSVVLGCTHYPFAKKAILNFFNNEVPIFDGGQGAARETRRRLERLNATNDKGGCITYFSSKNEAELQNFAKRYII